MMELSESFGDNKIKIGIYSINGNKPLFETVYPDGGMIEMIDSTHLSLTLPSDVTLGFKGMTTLRMAVFSADKTLVNAGENSIRINWAEEPVTKNI